MEDLYFYDFTYFCMELLMSKLVITTYVLRVLGTILVLIYFFGGSTLYNLFPALEGFNLNPVFFLGIAFYVLGSIVYYVIHKKQQKR